jgi:hypothetical protein
VSDERAELLEMNVDHGFGYVRLETVGGDVLEINIGESGYGDGPAKLTRSEVIALRDKLSEWIGDEGGALAAALTREREIQETLAAVVLSAGGEVTVTRNALREMIDSRNNSDFVTWTDAATGDQHIAVAPMARTIRTGDRDASVSREVVTEAARQVMEGRISGPSSPDSFQLTCMCGEVHTMRHGDRVTCACGTVYTYTPPSSFGGSDDMQSAARIAAKDCCKRARMGAEYGHGLDCVDDRERAERIRKGKE